MVVLNVTVNNCTPQTIVIGRRGTYDTLQIAFDLSYLVESYGNGVAVLAVKRSQDESAYPAVVTQGDNTLTWTVSETDTYYVGAGEAQLMWYVDGGLAKTIIYPMVVMKDILATSEEAPDAYQTWVDALIAEGAETLRNAQDAAQSASDAESAKDDAVTAKEAAEEAQEKAEIAVSHYPVIINGYWNVWSVEAQTYVSTGIQAEGEDGYSPEITITFIEGGHRVTITDKDHPQGQSFDVMDGQSGSTGDYTDLTNKPQINGHTLTGDQTAEQLGLATPSDIPTDAGDIEYDESETYQVGSVGAKLQEQTRHLSDLEDTVSTTQIINTASGAIASFSDGADGQPIRKLVAQIEPVQDLHGYDHPWPAGGGANQWDEEWEVGYIDGGTGLPTESSNSIRSNNFCPCIAETNYYVYTLLASDQQCNIYWYDSNKEYLSRTTVLTNPIASPANAAYFKLGLYRYGTTYNNNVAVNYPSTVTMYSPYSNECPISGHTVAEIQQTGVNLFPATADAFRILGTSAYAYRDLQLPSGTHLYLTVEDNDTSVVVPASTGVGFISKDTQGQNLQQDQFTWIVQNGNITTRHQNNPINGNTSIWLDSIFTFPNDQENLAKILKRWKFTLNIGDAAKSHEPYTGNKISVNWETEAGTVYGGEDEVISGKLKSTMAMVDLGTLDWYYFPSSNPPHFSAAVPGMKKLTNNILSDRYMVVKDRPYAYANLTIRTSDFHNPRGIHISDTDYTTVANFKAAVTGSMFVYELDEPVEYTLTGNEMETLYGTNNIWSSTGDTEVIYTADTKLYIENLTKPEEDDMTANANIAANTFFMIGNTLYFSTAAIAQGATIIPGTNCNVVSLADALNQLNT